MFLCPWRGAAKSLRQRPFLVKSLLTGKARMETTTTTTCRAC